MKINGVRVDEMTLELMYNHQHFASLNVLKFKFAKAATLFHTARYSFHICDTYNKVH
jgi:hypothetical protein